MNDLKNFPSGREVKRNTKQIIGGFLLFLGFMGASCLNTPNTASTPEFVVLAVVSLLSMLIGALLLGFLDNALVALKIKGKPL